MALALDHTKLEYGYFYSATFDPIKEYVYALIRSKDESVIVAMHSSGVFLSETSALEMHMPARPVLVLDSQFSEDFVSELLDNLEGLLNDIENFEEFKSSGWSYVPHTMRYWFKLYPCQPNPTASPSNRNNFGLSDQDLDRDSDNESVRSRSPIRSINDLAVAIVTHFFLKHNRHLPRRKVQLERVYVDYCREHLEVMTPHLYMNRFNLSNLRSWHESVLARYNIRVWTNRGNLLYSKRMGSHSDEWIELYLTTTGVFRYIRNLNTFFRKINLRVMCTKCYTFHPENKPCKLQILQAKTETIRERDLPPGRHGLVCYADFESIVQSDDTHKTSGYSIVGITLDGSVKFDTTKCVLEIPSGESIQTDFMETLFSFADEYVYEKFDLELDDLCQICSAPIEETEYVFGRNFVNGAYGKHHKKCWEDKENCLYVFFHNFRGYDSHFIMEEICNSYEIEYMQATSMEKFNLIRLCRKDAPLVFLTFKDTYNFFTASLASCVKMVEDWRYVEPEYQNSKGIFPYEWFDSFEKLKHEGLPPGPWKSKLTGKDTDPQPAIEVWEREGFELFYEYHNFYCRLDTLQLADIFEEFRRSCVSEFDVDPVRFMGAPSLSWFLGVRTNSSLFKVIPDTQVYLDIQSQIRGGVSQAILRHHVVGPEDSILFLDVNSLYSKCMTYKMPGKYITRIDGEPDNWKTDYGADSDYTLILCVDLFYPPELHDRDWPFPLAPHKHNERLCTTFLPRQNYLIHVELLLFYLERGLVLEEIHYAYKFRQDYALRDYVERNIDKRRETKSDVMKSLYKLLNNSIYGKTCENVFKYRDFRVVEEGENPRTGQVNAELSSSKDFIKYASSFLIERPKNEVTLCKPIQIGFTVLEFAKREIYRFIAALQDEFGDKVTPMYTDTDSIMLKCDFKQPWKRFHQSAKIRQFLDFEDIPPEWGKEYATIGTRKQSGLWSPEAGGKEIVEYVGLRAKCYAYRFADNETVLKNKGVPRSSTLTDGGAISFQDYMDSLEGGTDKRIAHYKIESKKHHVSTRKVTKLGIGSNDLKRTVLANHSISLPFGYQGQIYETNDIDE